jgi:hypothetical protein
VGGEVMSWVLLDGVDRSGKSTVANMYKQQGFEVVHMGAPNKEHFKPGYSGPSYLEEMVDLYSAYDGKDVVFDRTPYGELIWPEIFNRQALLTPEDLEYLQRLEYNNNAVKYVLYDEDKEAHWQRCVDNKEPINRLQFIQAGRLYDDLLSKRYNFESRQLGDFAVDGSEPSMAGSSNEDGDSQDNDSSGSVRRDSESEERTETVSGVAESDLSTKLERANAIKSLLDTSLVKRKGAVFKDLESDIKTFLQKELKNIFTESKDKSFTQEEVQILKVYAQRIKDKLG